MTIKIESTTDTPEAVAAAIGGLKQKEAPEVEAKQESAASDEAESTEESETSDVTDKEDGEELESKEGDGSDDDDSKEKDDEKPKKSGFKKRVERLNRRHLFEQLPEAFVHEPVERVELHFNQRRESQDIINTRV